MRRIILTLACVLATAAAEAETVRIKDIAFLQGLRDHALIGYGLVVGLQGTGDTLRNAPFTEQATQSMLERMGVNVRGNALRTRNLAAVMVTAELPPFAGRGTRIDVGVSSLGDASSLMGGTLIMTQLTGTDGRIYALAQGPLAVSGFSASGQNESLTQGVPTAGRIPNGAIVEADPPPPQTPAGGLVLELRNGDFTTAVRVADAINAHGRGRQIRARARDARTVVLTRPPALHVARLMADIGELRVAADAPARVVIDERTGTVVIGQEVRIATVAVTQGNLTVRVTETPQVSQPAPLSRGQTTVTSQTLVEANQPDSRVAILHGANLRTLVAGLNQVGLKPSGIIAILQAIKSAGALQAELVVQ